MNKAERLSSELMSYADFTVASPLIPVNLSPMAERSQNDYDSFKTRSSNKTQMLWFFADWCGHCRNMKQEWMKASRSGKRFAEWHSIDCGESNEISRQFNVRSFPSIKKLKHGRLREFQGNRTEKEFIRFARS